MEKYDYLIVGAGLFGATFAYLAKKSGKKSLIIDRRSHFGGNVYCENHESINVHRYGAHIFHTDNEKVWKLVNSIVPFNRYINSPVARYKDRLFNLPFNMNTFHEMWPDVFTPQDAMRRIDEQKALVIESMRSEGRITPMNLEEQARLLVGDDIYHTLIEGYTEKQWGRKCSQLPSLIIKRIPLRFTFDNNYFNSSYQGVPIGGYNKLINGLLKGTECFTKTDYITEREKPGNSAFHILDRRFEKVIFSGAIDEYFKFCFGKLQYRSVRFENELLNTPNYQGNAVVNYTDSSIPFTRIIEHKHFELFGDDVYKNPVTYISKEYPVEWQSGMEPYYPINDTTNMELFNRYKSLAINEHNIIFGGRLSEYKYYDMDRIIERAMEVIVE